MNQTFTLICLMMALAQSRVLVANRRLMQEAQANSYCATFSIVKPSEAGAGPSWLTNFWGIKVVPNQPISMAQSWCLYEAFEKQLPNLVELDYTFEVHDEASEFTLSGKRPEYLVIWFEGSYSNPKGVNSGKYTEKVYKFGENPLLSTFGTPSYFWKDLTQLGAKLVKHTPNTAYDVDPKELREISQRAVGGMGFDQPKLDRLVSELKKKEVSEVEYQGSLPKTTWGPMLIDESAFEFSLPQGQNGEGPQEIADEDFTEENTGAEASKRLENVKKCQD